MANIAYKFRIYPDKEQKIMLAKTFGCVRLVYNKFLDRRKTEYEDNKKTVSYTTCAKEMAEMKKTKEYNFLKEVDSIALQQSLRHLDTAFSNFFKVKNSGYPRFKSKKDTKRSYSTVLVNGNISLTNNYLKLPKVGNVKLKQHRKIPYYYKLKSITVSQNASEKYYASILFEYEKQVSKNIAYNFLGLDFSMHGLYKDSNGKEAEYPRYYRKAEQRLKKEQRKLSLMKKGSKNRDKQRIKLAKVHEKVANCRKDFLHKLSRELADTYDCICIEDLNMQQMSKAVNTSLRVLLCRICVPYGHNLQFKSVHILSGAF